MMYRVLPLLALLFATSAQAGLFSDDDARKQIQQLEERVLKLEDASKQQTKSMLDLQGQIEALNTEIRRLRGQNEELAHGLLNAEKREKDFYIDLDTRLRRFESVDEAAANNASSAAPVVPADPNDVTAENRAYEAAYGLYKGASYANAAKGFGGFIQNYPQSVHVPAAKFWLAQALYSIRDYEGALAAYRVLYKEHPDSAKVPDALLGIASCQTELKQVPTAQKTLKLLISKYPQSEAAAKAKKLLPAAK
ncbi:MAG: tol-pal system protein YbgF [Gallionella sp.]|nr:tol-pal system protein YbgF [Gallionella sp.]